MKKLIAAVMISFLGFPALAEQEPACLSRDVLVERLGSRYGESQQSIGIGQGNTVVEVFASRESGTWSILISYPDGTSCIVSWGLAFELTGSPEGEPA